MKKYAFWVKCPTFVLCVVLLLGVAVSGLGVLLSESMSLYSYEDYMSWRYSRSENMAYTLADQVIMDLCRSAKRQSPVAAGADRLCESH